MGSSGRTILNGNVRIKILEERGFEVDGLEREPRKLSEVNCDTTDEAVAFFIIFPVREEESARK